MGSEELGTVHLLPSTAVASTLNGTLNGEPGASDIAAFDLGNAGALRPAERGRFSRQLSLRLGDGPRPVRAARLGRFTAFIIPGSNLSVRRWRCAAAAAVLCWGSAAIAASDDAAAVLATKGAPNVPACAQCHGAGGEGMAAGGFPELAGQNASYLAKQLNDFAADRRASPIMGPIAKALKPTEMQSLADYYQALVAPPRSAAAQHQTAASAAGGVTPASASVAISLGARLAQRGDWDHDIPACFACHGSAGSGIGAHFPRIAGQNRLYTERQLNDWKNNVRANDPQGLMKAVADRLSDAQIAAVSLYLEQLPSTPLKP